MKPVQFCAGFICCTFPFSMSNYLGYGTCLNVHNNPYLRSKTNMTQPHYQAVEQSKSPLTCYLSIIYYPHWDI